jgi:hypothetical protein
MLYIKTQLKIKILKSSWFRLITFVLVAISWLSCGTENRKEKGQASAIIDTLNYGKMDYDSMRDYFSTDTLFLSTLSKRIGVGDTNSIKVRKLLATEFESREEVGLTEAEIEALILFSYTSKTVTEKFDELESGLLETDANSVRTRTDSIVKAIEKLKVEMKEGQRWQDGIED